MTRKLLINEADPAERRIAVVENGSIQEIHIYNPSREIHLGNIYLGKVANIEPSIGAAFVNFGGSRNGFLHATDVIPAYKEGRKPSEIVEPSKGREPEQEIDEDGDQDKESSGRQSAARVQIKDRLKRGQQVIVQITKDGIGGKGPSLTTHLSIPGRYLVLMPTLRKCGVSRKIADDKERGRLKKLVRSMANEAGPLGFIVRTAGINRTKKELSKDLDYLLKLWEHLQKRVKSAAAPATLYEETDLAIKTMRDLFSPSISEVVVDSEKAYNRILDFIGKIMPRYRKRVVHFDSPQPLFHHYNVEKELEVLFDNRVELVNGSSIVIEQTEALVAIDVNSGRFKKEADLEETAYQTNCEAVPEIVRQIRLRDLGGVIAVDFIDMMDEKHRREVEKQMRACLKDDRARVKMGKISQFGILEMTRQRVGPGLKRMLFSQCENCRGTGLVRSLSSQGIAVLRRIRTTLDHKGLSSIEVTVNPEVANYLLNELRQVISDLEKANNLSITIKGEPTFPSDGVNFQLTQVKEPESPARKRKRRR